MITGAVTLRQILDARADSGAVLCEQDTSTHIRKSILQDVDDLCIHCATWQEPKYAQWMLLSKSQSMCKVEYTLASTKAHLALILHSVQLINDNMIAERAMPIKLFRHATLQSASGAVM
jgi:hypothetical protein